MVFGLIGMSVFSKSVRHFVPSAKIFYLNLTITQAGSSYRICIGPSLCSKNIPFTIPIYPLTSLYSLSSFINNTTLHPTFNAVSFGKLHYFKQRFTPFDVINVEYWGIFFATVVRNIFRYLIVGSILYFHCVTRWLASLKIYLFFLFISKRKQLIKNSYFLFINVPFLIKDKTFETAHPFVLQNRSYEM